MKLSFLDADNKPNVGLCKESTLVMCLDLTKKGKGSAVFMLELGINVKINHGAMNAQSRVHLGLHNFLKFHRKVHLGLHN